MKKFASVITSLILSANIFSSMFLTSSAQQNSPALNLQDPLKTDIITEKSYVLYCPETRTFLAGKNPDEKLPMASLTKIMTLIIAGESLDKGIVKLSDEITASANASSKEGSVIWLSAGEKITFENLLKSMIISSANDSAYAVAEYLAGVISNNPTESEFLNLMNTRAKELGLNNTNYINSMGFDDENHYSSAADTAVLFSEMLKYEKYYGEWERTRLDELVHTDTRKPDKQKTQLLNTNKLLNNYEGLIGGKTGTTDNAKYCFVAGAIQNDLTFISVVLGGESDEMRFARTRQILDFGFWNYEKRNIKFEDIPQTVKVKNGINKTLLLDAEGEVSVVLLKSAGEAEISYNIPPVINAPVKEGDIVGYVTAKINGDVILESPLTASKTVEKYNFFKALQYLWSELF